MACILLRSSAVRVHDSQAYRKMDVTRERISRILELREILPSFQTGFNLVKAAVVCGLECKSGQECFWQGICGPFSIDDTNERGLRLLEFATFNNLESANTFGHHKASRKWAWHSSNEQHHSQLDYILVRKGFRSGVNSARTQSFQAADVGSEHDFLMTFNLCLKRIS